MHSQCQKLSRLNRLSLHTCLWVTPNKHTQVVLQKPKQETRCMECWTSISQTRHSAERFEQMNLTLPSINMQCSAHMRRAGLYHHGMFFFIAGRIWIKIQWLHRPRTAMWTLDVGPLRQKIHQQWSVRRVQNYSVLSGSSQKVALLLLFWTITCSFFWLEQKFTYPAPSSLELLIVPQLLRLVPIYYVRSSPLKNVTAATKAHLLWTAWCDCQIMHYFYGTFSQMQQTIVCLQHCP